MIGQKGAGCGPGQEVVRHPTGERNDRATQALASDAKVQQPLLQASGADPAWTGGTGQSPGDHLYSVLGDI